MFSYEIIQTLNQTEMSIYRYLTKNIDKVCYMSIRNMATELHISTSTILRFCHKVKLDGYNGLKHYITTLTINDQKNPMGEDLEALSLYFQQVNTDGFEVKLSEVVNTVSSASKVYFIGLGSSGALARYGARYFTNMGKFAVGLEDQYYLITDEMAENTVVIMLSVSGETAGLIDFADKCRERGCGIICITNNSSSHLAGMADVSLCYNTVYQKGPQGHNATTQVPVLFLIEAIARRL